MSTDQGTLAVGIRQPTSWTLPLQRVTAAFLSVSILWSLLSGVLFVSQASVARSLRASNPNLTADQVQSAASLGYTTGWVTVGIVAVLYAVLIAGSLRGWRWAFWITLVALAIGSIGVLTNSLALTDTAAQTQPAPATAVSLVLSAVSLAMTTWFIAAAVRFGPWAMRRSD